MNGPQDQPDRGERLGVVVGVDGTRLALDAVLWAGAEARLRGLPLLILHAAPYSDGSTAGKRHARDILARAYTVAYRARLGVPISTRRTEQDPVSSLLDASQRAHMLAVGMGGGERPQEMLIGSVALDVSGRAACPVAVVRGRHRPAAGAPVLVGVNDPAMDAAPLTVAFDHARRHGSRVVVLHARHAAPPFVGHEHTDDVLRAARYELREALTPFTTRFPDQPVELNVVLGTPTAALLAAAVRARVVVVGTHGHSAPARVLFGSTSRAVLRQSPVPVIVASPRSVLPDAQPVAAAPAPDHGGG